MIAPQHGGNLADGPAKLTKKGKEKVVSKKSSKEENAEVKGADAKSNSVQHNNSVGNVSHDGTPLHKYAPRRFVQRHLKLITLSAGYIINTFLYFWFIFLLNWVIDMLIYYLSKVSKYDYQSCMITTPLKMTVILFVWYRYFSAGYDGDPFFHFFKHRFGLINRSKSLGKSRPMRVHGSGVHGSGVHGSGVHGSGVHRSGVHGSGVHGSGVHRSGVHGSGVHRSGVHGSGVHRSGVHGSGVHGSGVHGSGVHDNHIRSIGDFPFECCWYMSLSEYTIFHYFGYKLASLLLKPPILSLHDASNYYKNIDPKILQKGVGPNGIVNLTSIPNELISDSSVVESYLGRFFQGIFHSFAMHEGGDFHTKKDQ
ncbi:conserved Plasmodium protein, unknown function [Plasmodium ovale curtisi]|nr:conserved Plasmodium protein, unknown function [Plasmodium ovale curtisi]